MSAYLRGTKAKFWTVQFYFGGKRVTVPTNVPERPTQDRGKEEAKQVGLLLREKMVAEAAIPKPIIPTFVEISEAMFLPDSEYLKFEAMAGRGMSDHWRGILHSLLRRYILPKWGGLTPSIRSRFSVGFLPCPSPITARRSSSKRFNALSTTTK